ncbi:MAG: hypothetical protein WC866_04480 [Patescibacteria group bacterium]|jgi:hypothetical protein
MPCCKDCQNVRSAAIMTNAECGHEATRAGMKLCERCSRQKDACECCGEQLNPDPPPHTD